MYHKISAIIVAYNEESIIEQIITELKKQEYKGEIELILADGGSTDKTVRLAKKHNVIIAQCDKKGKAHQMNSAAKIASGDILFFVHADMRFPVSLIASINQVISKGYSGGGFANIFDSDNDKIKQLGTLLNFRFFNNKEQSDKHIFYGDNGIFVLKKAFRQINGFKEIPIMEDYDFSKRLKARFNTIKIKDIEIVVSARRHLKAGFFKTRMQWVFIRLFYKWGVSPFLLAKWYKDIR